MKLRSNQRGISPLIIVLILLLIGLLGFAGWTVYNKNKKADSSSSESSTKKTTVTEKSAPKRVEVTYVKPVSKVYQVELPASWVNSTCADNPDLLFLAPTTDKLGKCQSEYFGTIAVSKNTGDIRHNEAYYKSDASYASVTFEPTTIDDFAAYIVSYTVATPNELGTPAVGTKIAQYVIFDGSNTYTISYSRPAGEPDLSTQFQTIGESFEVL